ncbi:MBL fold metallo-hydrolase [Clostridium estertheticum]|uniref:MBL fold metallo-hydrolase n=1 Tax=Clostridium estertheticum TaxID=238834 RepID=UPI001CF3AA23|nr:MBL fold metallo-hydrolase [Clostridium estertheticum]MCB2308862.1 MBL fold metallo-hydrolase [Clostridium estertheticum]MCB2347274.1 MBL fold metallo-hydrolase [Clostridium estertheticum]MCB2351885.1 MBL fold metallo-hydrolase [Clostridium estertheticum]WAG48477.1 MBL fold metallo-hydrolase [Clostridium estertheticum]
MKSLIKVLASGSSGNCYIIQTGEEKIVLECGIDYKSILKGLNYSIKGVVGCLISHKHLDHCKSHKKIFENLPKVIAPLEVLEKFDYMSSSKKVIAENKESIHIGNFIVMPFNCQHTNSDGSECENLGYFIHHKMIGRILFVTDTYYLKYKFKNVDHILIECNYSEDTIQALEPHEQRVFKSHMSLEILKETLKTWDLFSTRTITLIHLSRNNGEPKRFKKEIEQLTGIPTYIAIEGLEVG